MLFFVVVELSTALTVLENNIKNIIKNDSKISFFCFIEILHKKIILLYYVIENTKNLLNIKLNNQQKKEVYEKKIFNCK